jgi:hypothetical protein
LGPRKPEADGPAGLGRIDRLTRTGDAQPPILCQHPRNLPDVMHLVAPCSARGRQRSGYLRRADRCSGLAPCQQRKDLCCDVCIRHGESSNCVEGTGLRALAQQRIRAAAIGAQ